MESERAVSTLEHLRLERGLSLKEVEQATPVNRKTLGQLEHCLTPNPRGITIYRLAVFYKVNPGWLMQQYRRDFSETKLARAA